MEIEEVLGYAGALSIGLVLGLIGGGGSILTVPILVYAMSLNPVIATAYSLFIVGTTSMVGAIKNIIRKNVNFSIGLTFSLPAFTAVYLTRAYIIPGLPEILFTIGNLALTKNLFIMLFFAITMVFASLSMINDAKEKELTRPAHNNKLLLIGQGFLIGFVTGLIGAGGGFLIVPGLVLLAGLPMKKAVATSLFIISINSLVGFLGDFQTYDIDWLFLLSFTTISMIGIFVGIWLNRYINDKKLKKGFGWFVLFMGGYIIYKEISLQ